MPTPSYPARSLAPAILAGDGADLWLYLVAPLVGGLIGGAIYWFVRRDPAPEPASQS